jgi:hypothetical protein
MEFLDSLTGVTELQGSIKEIQASLDDISANVMLVESDYFDKAQKSMELKDKYFNCSKELVDFKLTKVIITSDINYQ